MAGRQARQGEEQQAIQNQFAMRQQQMQEQQFQQQQEEVTREQQFNQLVGQYVGQDTVDSLGVPQGQHQQQPAVSMNQLYALDPQRAMQLQQFRAAQAQAAREQERQQAAEVVTRAQYALKSEAPATLLRIGFPEFAQQLASKGIDVDSLDDDTVRGYAQRLIEQYGPVAGIAPTSEEGDAFTLSEGQKRFDARGKEIASVAPKPDADTKNPTALRKEFNDVTSGFQAIQSAYENVKSAQRGDAGDTQLVLNYMRTISPGIRIQPGESIADAASVPGISQGVIGIWNKLIGGGKLSDPQREELRSQAKATYETQRRQYTAKRDEYGRLAEKGGFDRRDVVGPEAMTENESSNNQAPAAAISYLQANPQFASQFKAKYGYLPQGF